VPVRRRLYVRGQFFLGQGVGGFEYLWVLRKKNWSSRAGDRYRPQSIRSRQLCW